MKIIILYKTPLLILMTSVVIQHLNFLHGKTVCTTYSELKMPETSKGGSRAPATSKMERFVIINNGFQPLTIITKCSIVHVAAALDPPLTTADNVSVRTDFLHLFCQGTFADFFQVLYK